MKPTERFFVHMYIFFIAMMFIFNERDMWQQVVISGIGTLTSMWGISNA